MILQQPSNGLCVRWTHASVPTGLVAAPLAFSLIQTVGNQDNLQVGDGVEKKTGRGQGTSVLRRSSAPELRGGVRRGRWLGRPQKPQHTPRQRDRAVVLFGFEPNLTRKRERLRIHGIVSTRAIEQRVQNKSVATNPNTNLRGTESYGAADYRQRRRIDDQAVF